jgi:DNA repair photolyase
MGKAIYNPKGPAGEYSFIACNLYNGCEGDCDYCYLKDGVWAKVLGGKVSTLKKQLVNEDKAYQIFKKEMFQNIDELRKHGLHFNFVGDPFLPKTIELNTRCMRLCVVNGVPVKTLSKQTWWVNDFLSEIYQNETIWNCLAHKIKPLFAFGWTLTGHDELEKGANTNAERIGALKVLNMEGFKTWASIEPIIDFESSERMIAETKTYCDLYKIGLQSGKKYKPEDIRKFMNAVNFQLSFSSITPRVYWKDSLLKQAGIDRADLPSNCVDRDFNIFQS